MGRRQRRTWASTCDGCVTGKRQQRELAAWRAEDKTCNPCLMKQLVTHEKIRNHVGIDHLPFVTPTVVDVAPTWGITGGLRHP